MSIYFRRSWVWLLLLPVIVLGFRVASVGAATPPVVDLNGDAPGGDFSATFTEDEGGEAIVSPTGLTIDNGTDTTLTAAKATLTNMPDTVYESLSADAGATGLNVQYSEESGELTIKGSNSVAAYEQVLRTLTYNNSSQSPDIADRIVLVTVSDGQLVSSPATSTIAINAVNDAPVLDNSGNMILATINEDPDLSLYSGNSVMTIIKSAETGGEDRITDADEGSLEGIAVIEAGAGNGVWQYSIDSGINWLPFNTVSNTSAVLLDSKARIRFAPNPNYSGTSSFSFRAWDQSGGRPSGSTGVDVSLNGGITPFSAESEMVTINILSANDLPIVDLNGPAAGRDFTTQFYESGSPVPIADLTATISDEDHASLASLTVTLTNRPDGPAESLAATTTGTNITAAPYDPATGRLVLTGPDTTANFQQVVRLITYQNSSVGPAPAARQVTVIANDSVNDGPVATSMIVVNPVNSAPVLAAVVLTLGDTAEDTPQPAGATIATILAGGGDPITDPDGGAQEGIAIVGVDDSHGQWQYATTNPPAAETDWTPVGGVSNTAALLLSDAAWLRFVPASNYFGPSGNLTFRAWDRTSGANGQRDVDVSLNGGNTAFSVNTATLAATITPANDPPVVGGLPGAPLLYVEDDDPLPLASATLTVSDVDNTLLAAATVRITNPLDGDAEWLLVNTNGFGITSVYADGVLQLTGAASPAAYQQVLRSVRYWNASQDPSPDDRQIEFSVADNTGSGAVAGMSVQVQPVNDPPELDLDGVGPGLDFGTTFYINRGPVPAVAESMTVTDIDNTTLKSATVRITNPRDGQAEILSVDTGGVANIKVNYDLANYVLTLSGVDSLANYQRVLRTVTYNNTLPQPDTEIRVIDFIATDNTGASEAGHTSLTFAAAPSVHLFLPMVSWAYQRGEEPNDICSQALGLVLNVDQSFQADDRMDWFYFELPSVADVVVELRDFTPRQGQVIIYRELVSGGACFSEDNTQLVGHDGNPNTIDKIVSLGQQPAGRYYIWVINDGPQDPGAVYRLFVRAVPPA